MKIKTEKGEVIPIGNARMSYGIVLEINGKGLAIPVEESDNWKPFKAFKLKIRDLLHIKSVIDFYLEKGDEK